MQTTVPVYPASAVPGDRASQNPVIYVPYNCFADSNGVTVGGFVWRGEASDGPRTVSASGAGTPFGFVERILVNYNYEPTEEGSLAIVPGGIVAVAMRGDFWAMADQAVSEGDPVYADSSTGAVTFASGEPTGFTAMTDGDAGDMVIISNWFGSSSDSSGSGSASGDLSNYLLRDLSNVTGVLPVANGGTGLDAVGDDGQVLTSTGSGLVYEDSTSSDLSDYVKNEDLEGYAKTEDLEGYATQSELDNYATTASVTEALEGYATEEDLGNYVTTSALSEAGYITSSALEGYATDEEVAETVNSALSGYVTSDALDSTLSGYATTDSLSGYVTSDTLSNTLTNYAQTSSLGDLASKSQVDLFTDVTGTLPTSNGGTGSTDGSITGNAATATKLATAQTITLTGAVEGTSGAFDGSAGVTITTTLASSESTD